MFFDDNYNYYRSPYARPRYTSMRSPYGVDSYQSMVEEEMRRRELERYQAMRQREEMRRQQEEEAYLRDLRRKELLRKAQQQKSRNPQYSIVRGPDGRLYRIRADTDDDSDDEGFLERSQGSSKQPKFVRGSDGNIYLHPSGYKPQQREKPRQQKKRDEDQMDVSESSTRPNATLKMENFPSRSTGISVNVPMRTVNDRVDREEEDAIGKNSLSMAGLNLKAEEMTTRKSKKGRRQKVTVIVEDASDSENEDDELSSVWRNRRPGPGQSWMEPVEM